MKVSEKLSDLKKLKAMEDQAKVQMLANKMIDLMNQESPELGVLALLATCSNILQQIRTTVPGEATDGAILMLLDSIKINVFEDIEHVH